MLVSTAPGRPPALGRRRGPPDRSATAGDDLGVGVVLGKPLHVVLDGPQPGRRHPPAAGRHPAGMNRASATWSTVPSISDPTGAPSPLLRQTPIVQRRRRRDVAAGPLRRRGRSRPVPRRGSPCRDRPAPGARRAARPAAPCRPRGCGVLGRDAGRAHEERPRSGAISASMASRSTYPLDIGPGPHREAGKGAVPPSPRGRCARWTRRAPPHRRRQVRGPPSRLARKRPSDGEETGFEAEDVGDLLLKRQHGGVLGVHVVADLGIGHRAPHLRRTAR